MFEILMNETQKALRDSAKEFTAKEIIPNCAKWDQEGKFPLDAYKKAFEIGLTTVGIPEEYGGMGMGLSEEVIIEEQLGYGDAGFAVSAECNHLGTLGILMSGNEAMKQVAADVLRRGGFASFALTEADAGSDAAAIRTTAVKDGDEYVINGSKCFITNGGLADIYTVFATMDKTKGHKGIAAFLVERDRPGVSVGKEEDKMGIRASNTTEVVFDNVRIPADHLLVEEGKGFVHALNALNRTRAMGMAVAVGLMQRALDLSVEYAKTRVMFGKPIIKNQAIQFMLADMEIQIQAARTMVWNACNMIDKGQADPGYGSCVKAFVGDAVMKVTTDAVQIFGGYGYSREYPVEKLMRDAKIWNIFEGTAQIQRITIASGLMRK